MIERRRSVLVTEQFGIEINAFVAQSVKHQAFNLTVSGCVCDIEYHLRQKFWSETEQFP